MVTVYISPWLRFRFHHGYGLHVTVVIVYKLPWSQLIGYHGNPIDITMIKGFHVYSLFVTMATVDIILYAVMFIVTLATI